MTSKKLFSGYKRFVFGNTLISDFERRIFLLVTHISLIIALAGIAIDIVMSFPDELVITTIVAFFILLFFHIKVRNSKSYKIYILIFFVLSVITICVLWFLNSGYDGNTSILMYLLFIITISILPPKLRFTAYVTYTVMILTLVGIQHFYPELIIPYANKEQRVVDLMIGFVIYITFAYNTQTLILKNYAYEQEKVKTKNNQLNELIGKLNDAKAKIEDSFQKMNELNNSKDRFIAVLSHDLRSPFQGIMGMAKLLQEEYDIIPDEEKKIYISRLNQSLERHYSFMEELLLWGRMQRNSVSLYIEDVKIKEFLGAAASVFSGFASDKKIKIEIKCPGELTSKLDKDLISVVIRNLISNAIKFSPVNSTITIEAQKTSLGLKIAVIDNGVGIMEEDLEKLFRIEQTFSTPGTGGESGSGFGLILCTEILKKHNGSILVQSKEGRGSVFTFQIPDKK